MGSYFYWYQWSLVLIIDFNIDDFKVKNFYFTIDKPGKESRLDLLDKEEREANFVREYRKFSSIDRRVNDDSNEEEEEQYMILRATSNGNGTNNGGIDSLFLSFKLYRFVNSRSGNNSSKSCSNEYTSSCSLHWFER